jgi:hypothetical protein
MSTHSHLPSAKIYQFPRKTSANPSGAIREVRSATDHRQRAVASVEFGSGWYHEAAVQAEWPRKS